MEKYVSEHWPAAIDEEAVVVPRIKRLSTARCVLHRFIWDASEETISTFSLRCLGGKINSCLLGESIRRRPVLPRPAMPCRPAMRHLARLARSRFEFLKQCAVRCCATLYYAVLCCVVPCCAMLCHATLCCAMLFYAMLSCPLMFCAMLYCTRLCHII